MGHVCCTFQVAHGFHFAHPPGKTGTPPTLQMKKLRLREVKGPAQAPQLFSGKGDSNPGVLATARHPSCPPPRSRRLPAPISGPDTAPHQGRGVAGGRAWVQRPRGWTSEVHTPVGPDPFGAMISLLSTLAPQLHSQGGGWGLGLFAPRPAQRPSPAGAQARPQNQEPLKVAEPQEPPWGSRHGCPWAAAIEPQDGPSGQPSSPEPRSGS